MYLSNLFVVDGCVDQSKQYRIGVTIDQQHIYGVGSKKCAFDFDSLSVQWEISTGDKITNTSNSGGSTTGAISISTTSNPSTSPAIDKHSISTLKTCTSRPQVSTTTPHNNGYSIILNSTSPDSNGGIGSTDPEKTISKASVMSSQTLTAIIVLTVVTLLMTILCVVVFVCRLYKKLPCSTLIELPQVEFSHRRLDGSHTLNNDHVSNRENYHPHVSNSAVSLHNVTNEEDIYSEINDELYEEIQDVNNDCELNLSPQRMVPTTRNVITQENTIDGIYVVNPECAANPEQTV